MLSIGQIKNICKNLSLQINLFPYIAAIAEKNNVVFSILNLIYKWKNKINDKKQYIKSI